MKIEKGKFYKTKSGEKVGPAKPASYYEGDMWSLGKMRVYGPDGTYGPTLRQEDERHNDLVEEWHDEHRTWGELTDAEKGALLLAEYEGGKFALEYTIPGPDKSWGQKSIHEAFNDEWVYRVAPKRETVTLHTGQSFMAGSKDPMNHDTHRITFDLIDGEPDVSTIRMEKIND